MRRRLFFGKASQSFVFVEPEIAFGFAVFKKAAEQVQIFRCRDFDIAAVSFDQRYFFATALHQGTGVHDSLVIWVVCADRPVRVHYFAKTEALRRLCRVHAAAWNDLFNQLAAFAHDWCFEHRGTGDRAAGFFDRRDVFRNQPLRDKRSIFPALRYNSLYTRCRSRQFPGDRQKFPVYK